MKEIDIYTGRLTYKEIEFTFVFDKKKLKLIPIKEKRDDVANWFRKKITPEVYTNADPIYINEVLIGYCVETGCNIIFFPSDKSIGRINSSVIVNIDHYIVNKHNRDTIDRIAIRSPEITHIFPTYNALGKIKWNEDGEFNISTRSFTETTTDKERINFGGKDVYVYWGISVFTSQKTGEAPLRLTSTMFLEFEPTDDYGFIIELLEMSKQFIKFLVYRQNITFTEVQLSTPFSDGKHENFAQLYETKEIADCEEHTLERGRFIKYEYIKGKISNILHDMIAGNMYLKHIPKSFEDGRNIDAGKFIMITSGFEWEFRRCFPEGIEKSPQRVEAETRVAAIIEPSITENTGKIKEILKYLKKRIKDDSFASRIIEYGQKYGYISNMFGEHLYNMNEETLEYDKMGKRLGDQRNHFAHGDLDKEFIGLSLLDLIYLERVIYIMQLKFHGVDDINIKKAVNDLFGCGLMINE